MLVLNIVAIVMAIAIIIIFSKLHAVYSYIGKNNPGLFICFLIGLLLASIIVVEIVYYNNIG